MQIRRVFGSLPYKNGITVLSEKESHYALKVLRLKENDTVELITEKGCASGILRILSKNKAAVIVEEEFKIKNEPDTVIALFQAIPDNFDKLELIVQKATELGISEIHTFLSRYTDSKYKKINLSKKFARLEKIALEAVRQCKRTFPPEILPPKPLNEAVNYASEHFENTIVLGEKGNTIKKEIKKGKFALFVGSEGGFSEEEFDNFIQNGFYFLNLGGRILRTETAAIAGITIIQTLFGDFAKHL